MNLTSFVFISLSSFYKTSLVYSVALEISMLLENLPYTLCGLLMRDWILYKDVVYLDCAFRFANHQIARCILDNCEPYCAKDYYCKPTNFLSESQSGCGNR